MENFLNIKTHIVPTADHRKVYFDTSERKIWLEDKTKTFKMSYYSE